LAKVKTVFFCRNCGASSPKWIGNCPNCNEWNTYVEEKISSSSHTRKSGIKSSRARDAVKVNEIPLGNDFRVKTKDKELNRVLGGGIVTGSVVLLGGQPGIGKSTLLLQLVLKNKIKVLYVSGEESESQLKARASRVGIINDDCYILAETNVEHILKQADNIHPQLIIIDSIQTLYDPNVDSAAGTIVQIRESTGRMLRFAKENNVPVFVIGHITKDGAIAGPKLLEHMVDTVLQFEGDRHHTYRILRCIKNRFGSTDEIGLYEMKSDGLRQVENPSELLLSQNQELLSGSTVGVTLEGIRPMLIETQALVSRAVYGTPQRSATGFDLRRLHMLLAVLEKRCGLPFGQNDVFLNMAGGLKIVDPAIDLSIVSALISSLQDIAVDKSYCFSAEVGLSGEIRAVNRIEQRIQEADRLGFKKIFVSKYNLKGIDPKKYEIMIHPIAKLEDLLFDLFG
jgi:DNA repair protein RadA/Sms